MYMYWGNGQPGPLDGSSPDPGAMAIVWSQGFALAGSGSASVTTAPGYRRAVRYAVEPSIAPAA